MNKKIIYIILFIIAFGGLLLVIPSEQKQNEIEKIREVSIPDNSNLFKSEKYGFSLEYPKELAIKEYEEGGGSHTIIFQKIGELFGFQIFVTPYSKDEITEAQLTKDIRSGEIRRPTEILIGKDGDIRALIFETDSSIIGETREVWFINNGYLYEVTTYLEHDQWLSDILSTFEFI